jgi:HAD superfamily hydrolase (TIGR01509 family)
MIKAVSFDFWFTISSINNEGDTKINDVRQKGLEQLFKHYGIPFVSKDIIPKMLEAKRNIIQRKKDEGFIDFSSRHYQLPYVLEYMIPEMPTYLSRSNPILKNDFVNSFCDIVTKALLSHIPPLVPNVSSAIQHVKNQGLKLGIVSNTGLTEGNTLREVLDHYELLQYFDETLFSDEVELMKPNPKFFQKLADKLDLEPSEIIHVGDTIFADIVGARKAGLHEGVLYLGVFDDNYQYRNLEEDFKEYQPRYVIDDYADFPNVLNAILKGDSSFCKINNKNIKKRLKLD